MFSAQEKELFLPTVRQCLENRPDKRPSSAMLVRELRRIKSTLPSGSHVAAPIEHLHQLLSAKEEECRQKDEALRARDEAMREKDATIQEKESSNQVQRAEILKQQDTIREQQASNEAQRTTIQELQDTLQAQQAKIEQLRKQLAVVEQVSCHISS